VETAHITEPALASLGAVLAIMSNAGTLVFARFLEGGYRRCATGSSSPCW
jgi:hypothetical protein